MIREVRGKKGGDVIFESHTYTYGENGMTSEKGSGDLLE